MNSNSNSPATRQIVTAVGTSAIWGTVDGIIIESMVQGPAAQATPLQIACVFEYTEGDIFISPPALPAESNGMVHLDKALNGLITDIRRSGKFEGHALETLMITPPDSHIRPDKLLLIGLGDRNIFDPALMIKVSQVGMREALRLGVPSYSFAADIKDAGIHSPIGVVAGNIVDGAVRGYRTEEYLKSKGMFVNTSINKLTLLAGMKFFAEAGEGIKASIAALQRITPTENFALKNS